MIDLHLHLDGSLRPETVRELLRYKNIKDFPTAEDAKKALCVDENCRNLNEYLQKFDFPILVLQQENEIIRAVSELGMDLFKEEVEYAEIRFAPMFSMKEGLDMEAVCEAAIAGAKEAENRCGIKLELILCCMRGADEKMNKKTLECTKRYLGKGICAMDLAGAEGLFPTEMYRDLFKEASKLDVPFTIHAGEAAGPQSIWKALEFGAQRIGHGIRSFEDPDLVDYLVRKEIPIEVCPTSNMQTKVYGNPDFYPLKELLELGVRATLNTDNRTVSNTNLFKETEFAKKSLRLDDKDIELMKEYSKKAAFVKR